MQGVYKSTFAITYDNHDDNNSDDVANNNSLYLTSTYNVQKISIFRKRAMHSAN